MAITAIEQGLEASGRLLEQTKAFISSQILSSFLDKIPGVDIIGNEIMHLIEQIETTEYVAYQEIKSQIEPLIANAIPAAITTLVGIGETFGTDIHTLVGEIATVDDVAQTLLTTLKSQSPHLADWLYRNVVGQFGNIALGVLETIETESAGGVNPILDELLKVPGLPDWIIEPIKAARARNAPAFAFILPAVILASLLPILGAIGEPFVTAVRQEAFREHPSKVTEPNVLIQSLFRGIITDKQYADEMGQSGFASDVALRYLDVAKPLLDPETATRAYLHGFIQHDEWETQLVKRGFDTEQARVNYLAALPLLSEDAIRNSYLRNLINTEQHDAALSQYGYSAAQAERMRTLYFFIPGPQDLIHMGIRNVFVQEIVDRFTLDGDKPQAFVDAAKQQGISDYWAGKFWQAHWIMPGREAFFEMFQRTLDKPIDPTADKITLTDGTEVYNVIGRDTLNLALRDIDTPPFYRDKLLQIAYRPFTRIDIRRMASVGILNHAQVERAYLNLGYNQANARLLADYVDTLNSKVRKDEAATLVDNLRKEIIRLFVAGKLPEDEIKATLKDLLFTDAEIAVFIQEAALVRESQFATITETGIGKLYVDGIITDKQAIQRMQDAHVPIDAQSLLFQKWDLEIEYKGGSTHIHKHRELTSAEVEQALADGLITPEDATQHFLDMGYDNASATGKVSLTLYKAARATKTAQVAAIRASYVNGTIESLEASNRLDALLVPSGQRDAYLNTWTLERETRTERIPLATLRDMALGNYITEADLLTHLKRHRFTDADATLVIRFWMSQKPPKSLVPAQ